MVIKAIPKKNNCKKAKWLSEDKQLFIKRNQELLEKVCGAQHPNGAEERLMRDPGAAGGPLRSGTGARGRGGFSGCAPLCCVPNRISVPAITIS